MSSPYLLYFLADGQVWVSTDINLYPPTPPYNDVSPNAPIPPDSVVAIFKVSSDAKYQQLGTISAQSSAQFNDAVATALGAAAPYGILAAAGITNTGNTTVIPYPAVVGSFPTPSITGFPVGSVTVDNTDAAAAHTAALAAYNTYSALTFTSLGGALDLSTAFSGSNVVTPGNYSFGAALCTLGLVLNGPGLYVFKGSSTINLASGQAILLTNGAQADNVVWLVGSSLTTTATSTFVGTILANTSITLGGGVLVGRALAGIVTSSGAVTIAAGTAITVPTSTSGGVGPLANVSITNAVGINRVDGALTGGNGRNGLEIT